jgi:hypothetical protein
MEVAFKKGFRTFRGKRLFSSVMISPAKIAPPAASRFLQTKIHMIESEKIKSSPQVQDRFCQFRRQIRDTCLACSPLKEKLEKDKDLINLHSSDDE